jgi:Leucine-rich repeat (LRR) protein
MNDLERIKQIEEILGVKFHQNNQHGSDDEKNNYTVDENGNVIKLSLYNTTLIDKKISDLLSGFKSVTILDLGTVNFSDYSFIKELKEIEALSIRSNSFVDASVLSGLGKIKILFLLSNNLNNLSFLKSLNQLTFLILISNNVIDISFLKEMKELTSLNLMSNKLIDITALKDLHNLKSLDLSYNELNDVSILESLINISHLDLDSNNLSDVSFLKNLVNLESLDLSSNQISDISSLTKLKNIKSLKLRSNKLTNVSIIKDLINLESIDLSYNELEDINFLSGLNSLTSLQLDQSLIDLSAIQKLVGLNTLSLSNNNLTDIDFIGDLINLKSLNLSNNNLTDISILKNLSNLNLLDLRTNKINVLPKVVCDFDMELIFTAESVKTGEMNFYDNPIKTPPLYLVQRGKEAIKKYFQKGEPYLDSIQIDNYFSLESISAVNLADKKEIYFLGENGDGKTILLQAIALALKGDQKFGIISDVLKDNTIFLTEQKESTVEKNLNLADFLFGNSNIKNESVEFYQHTRSDKKNTQQKKEIIIAEPIFETTDSFGYKKQYKEGNTDFPHLNVYAYGINRVFNKNDETREDENKEVYLSLFDHRYGLTDPVQWLKDIRLLTLDNKEKGLPEPTITVSRAKQLLSELLSKEIDIKISGISVTFSEKGSAPVSFRQLSDGYKSVINWLCDLLSRLSQNQPHVSKLEDYYGIVLVDEIGVYLHPRLQFSLIRMLRDKFKKIQWIFTTHSPIITLGASEDAVFYKLYKENGKTQLAGPVNGISGMTANSLITSILWRLDEFTTQGTNINQINSDDYIYKVIHDAIRERIKKNINLSDKDTAQMVQKLLDNLKTLESKMTQDLESDISAANELIDA